MHSGKPLINHFVSWHFVLNGKVTKKMEINHLTHIPIALDGTCNGLASFFSLLLRDEVGGAATNLIPSEKPQDIYAIVADRTTEALKQETSNELYREKYHLTKKQLAQAWLEDRN